MREKNTKVFGVKKPKLDGIKSRPRREGRGSQQEVKIKNKKNGLNQLFRILKHTPVYYIRISNATNYFGEDFDFLNGDCHLFNVDSLYYCLLISEFKKDQSQNLH